MSLSTWFRDYLFIPLGGSQRGARRTVANLVVTMFLAGLWHGAAWTFVVWGLVHGAFLAGHAVLRRAGPDAAQRRPLNRIAHLRRRLRRVRHLPLAEPSGRRRRALLDGGPPRPRPGDPRLHALLPVQFGLADRRRCSSS